MQSTPRSRAKSSQSSIERSGSRSRTSRGVSSWSAAVSTPIFMNFGSNLRTDIEYEVYCMETERQIRGQTGEFPFLQFRKREFTRLTLNFLCLCLCVSGAVVAQQSPASQRPPQT